MAILVEGDVVQLARIDDDQVSRDHTVRDAADPNVHIHVKRVEIFDIFVIMIAFNADLIALAGFLGIAIEALYPAFYPVDGKGLFGKEMHNNLHSAALRQHK